MNHHSPAMSQFRRIPLILILALALLIAGLLMLALESNGGAGQPKDTHLPFVKASSVSNPGNDFNNPGGNPEKHCNDGHGKDGEHNKHCRGISGT